MAAKRTIAELSALHAWETPEWAALRAHADAAGSMPHLRDLLQDPARCAALVAAVPGLHLDLARQRVTAETMSLLFNLARAAAVPEKIAAMAAGAHLNATEDRAVGHIALRAPRGASIQIDGADVVPAVHAVLDRIAAFANKVRAGEHVGATGKPLTDVVSIGIGGSYLGPEFAFEALRHDPAGKAAAAGRRLRFLANVDPVDVARALEDFDPETTLVIICSKTFTTAETMLNARTVKRIFEAAMPAQGAEVAARHIVACSANVPPLAAPDPNRYSGPPAHGS